jgi:hypothetical protein
MDLKLLEKALQLEKDLAPPEQGSEKGGGFCACPHLNTIEIEFEVICEACNEILSDKSISLSTINCKQRSKKEFTFFKNIPNVSRETWDLTINIFKEITQGQNLPYKRNIILGCLHYATILRKDSVCFTDILKHTAYKKSRNLSKGIAFVTSKIPRGSPYFIQNHNDYMIVKSILNKLDLLSELCYVERLIKFLEVRSSLFNTSHYKTIVCGCIYYWISLYNNMSFVEFASKVNVSVMTVKKKYLGIKLIVYRYALRSIFRSLLKATRKVICGVRCPDVTNKENCLTNLMYNLTVENFESGDLKVWNNVNKYLPLEDVTNLCDWNYLLDTVYYDKNNYEYRLNVCLRSSFKLSDLTFNFKQYDAYNNVSGALITKTAIIDTIKALEG